MLLVRNRKTSQALPLLLMYQPNNTNTSDTLLDNHATTIKHKSSLPCPISVIPIPWVWHLREFQHFPHPFLQGGVGVVHPGLRRDGRGRGDKAGVNHSHPGQPLSKGYSSVGHRVYQEVVHHGWGWSWSFPVQGEVQRHEASCKSSCGVLRPV